MMLNQRPAELLKEEIEGILSSLADTAGLFNIINESLHQPSHRSKNQPEACVSWALLPLWICEAVCGRYEPAIPAAASLQLLRAAAEVFDDLEDADSSASLSSKYGPAIAINAASALLILAEKAIPRLKIRNVDDRTIVRVMEVINRYYMTTCSGQHLDLSLPPETLISEDDYFKIAYLKSASTIECACHTGALLACAAPELIDKFAKFGYNLGMMAQIANDLEGITSGVDIRKSKVTLPAIYALSQTQGETHHQLELAFGKPSEFPPDPTQIRDLLFHTGAIYYTSLKMEVYRQAARNILDEIENAGPNVERLKRFLE